MVVKKKQQRMDDTRLAKSGCHVQKEKLTPSTGLLKED
jgi:hypothetical protein